MVPEAWIRTSDLSDVNRALYRLSYSGAPFQSVETCIQTPRQISTAELLASLIGGEASEITCVTYHPLRPRICCSISWPSVSSREVRSRCGSVALRWNTHSLVAGNSLAATRPD